MKPIEQNNKEAGAVQRLGSPLPEGKPRQRVSQAIRTILGWASGLSIWYRFTLGTFLGALGGSTFVGFLNTYALYNYAYHFGARIPVEGVPYLSLAVSVVSFAFLLVSLTCATLVYGLLLLVSLVLRNTFELVKTTYSTVAKSRAWKVVGELIPPIVAGLTTSLGFNFATLRVSNVTLPDTVLVGSILVVALILSILAIWPYLVKWSAGLLTLALIGVVSFALFQAPFYASFLRLIRYGGGTAVELTCRTPSMCPGAGQAFLFLVTSEVYLLYNPTRRFFMEIPTGEVLRLDYRTVAEYGLPE